MKHRIGFFLFDGVTMLDLSGPAEVLHTAENSDGSAHYELMYVSPAGGDVQTSSNMVIARTISADHVTGLDTLIICGADHLPVTQINQEVIEAARHLVYSSGRVVSICTGAFILAELGILDHRHATTHWRHASTLARRYPHVAVERDVIFVQDDKLFTSAGVSAGMDLALHLVEADLGPEQARHVARNLVMFMQRPGGQSQFSIPLEYPVPNNNSLRVLLDEIVASPAELYSVSSMAKRMNVSARHLARMFQQELGESPTRWLERIRTGAAAQFILEGHPITVAAQLSGFGNDETMRRAFHRQFGVSPSEYRARFNSTVHNAASR